MVSTSQASSPEERNRWMADSRTPLLPVESALHVVLAGVRPLGTERVALTEVFGRVIAEDIVAGRDVPPWDNSGVDGYAVVAEDVGQATPDRPASLTLVEEIPAGGMPIQSIRRGTAARIMTGAPMPSGADAVVMVEDTSSQGERVLVQTPVERGESVRKRGQDVREGAVVVTPGRRARAVEVGMLASVGCLGVTVGRRPRVGILATGDELADAGEPPRPERIFNTNSYAIAAQVVEAGGIPLLLGIARDTPDALRAKLSGRDGFDTLVVCGGMSVGKFDFVKDVLAELGMVMDFWRVAMKPGSPMAFGRVGTQPVFGLPGNPVSAMVTFELFVRPALLRMAGCRELGRPIVIAELSETIEKPKGKTHFIRGIVRREGDRLRVGSTGGQDSGVLTSMVRANGLIVLPQDEERFGSGQTVEVRLLQGDAA